MIGVNNSEIDPYDPNSTFNREKEVVKLIHRMEDGEITEDEFHEEFEKIQNIINSKEKKELVDIEMDEKSPKKKESESYSDYFSNHKKEFRNILGL